MPEICQCFLKRGLLQRLFCHGRLSELRQSESSASWPRLSLGGQSQYQEYAVQHHHTISSKAATSSSPSPFQTCASSPCGCCGMLQAAAPGSGAHSLGMKGSTICKWLLAGVLQDHAGRAGHADCLPQGRLCRPLLPGSRFLLCCHRHLGDYPCYIVGQRLGSCAYC